MRIGVDVGGTFTDVVTSVPGRGIVSVKTPSTPDDPARGVMAGLGVLAAELGLSGQDTPEGLAQLIHGTTVATNILVERKGARVGILTTRGFRDLLELRDGTKQNRYQLRDAFPAPLVPRILRQEIDERVLQDGHVERPLDMAQVDAAIDTLLAEGVEAIAICLLHSHRFPDHEQAVAARVAERSPGLYVAVSSEILRRGGEYDRLSTAVADAYAGPGLAGYLGRLERDLRSRGVDAPVAIMQSNGGVLPVAEAARRASGAVTSGPAGGAVAAALYARHYGLDEVVSFDTGGTSSDICVVLGGTPIEADSKTLADTRIAVPAIEIDPVALGGGSIASLGATGLLGVGPHSAGAAPGPAAFGRGGTEPTVTDANLVLGYLAPDAFLGGTMSLDAGAARAAISARIAEPLGIGTEDAAEAIHALATVKIAEGLRRATVRRGLDPRSFVLLPFGGAGGLHADAAARELSMRRAIIPQQASVLSALGFLASDLRRDVSAPLSQPLDQLDDDGIAARIEALREQATRELAAIGVTPPAMSFRLEAVCRYRKQVSSLAVPIPEAPATGGLASALQAEFETRYRALFHHVHPEPAFVEELRIAGFGRMDRIALPDIPEMPQFASAASHREIRFGGKTLRAGVYDLDAMQPGAHFEGPAIAVSRQTTVLVLPGTKARLDASRSLVLDIPET